MTIDLYNISNGYIPYANGGSKQSIPLYNVPQVQGIASSIFSKLFSVLTGTMQKKVTLENGQEKTIRVPMPTDPNAIDLGVNAWS